MEKPFSIECHELVKVYGREKFLAVDKISFNVEAGEIFGLIGPDGAGKTSIFRMLTTLLLPDGGHAKVMGHDVVKDYKHIRSAIGYMPGKFSLYQDLTVEENLDFFASVFNTTVEENYHLVEDIYVQLEPFKKRRAGKLSGGMKQKLALCCALIHKPEVLFLDEPTTGVDPVSRKEFWQMLKRLKKQGISILVATPYMDEAALCDKIALIKGGKILKTDTPENITAAYPHMLLKMRAANMQELIKNARQYPQVLSCFGFGEFAHAALAVPSDPSTPRQAQGSGSEGKSLPEPAEDTTSTTKAIHDLQSFLEPKNLKDLEIAMAEPGIEDVFIDLSMSPPES